MNELGNCSKIINELDNCFGSADVLQQCSSYDKWARAVHYIYSRQDTCLVTWKYSLRHKSDKCQASSILLLSWAFYINWATSVLVFCWFINYSELGSCYGHRALNLQHRRPPTSSSSSSSSSSVTSSRVKLCPERLRDLESLWRLYSSSRRNMTEPHMRELDNMCIRNLKSTALEVSVQSTSSFYCALHKFCNSFE